MTSNAKERCINTFSDLIEFLSKGFAAEDAHPHVHFWFRGHAKDDWKLTPGVYRPDFRFPGKTEAERLRREQHLNKDWRVMSAGVREGDEDEVHLYFQQLHYGLPTRLLDWSTIPMPALYFAVNDPAYDSWDGMFYEMDSYRISQDQKEAQSAGFEGIATSRNPHFQRFVKVLAEWKKESCFPRFVIPVRPDYRDRRWLCKAAISLLTHRIEQNLQDQITERSR